MRLFFDTSVLVAALVEGHPRHEAAYPWLEDVAAGRHHMGMCAHSLAELLGVLPRIPVTPRIPPALVFNLIQQNVLPHAEVFALTNDDYLSVLEDLSRAGQAGPMVYDALILKAASLWRAERLLTFNKADFLRAQAASSGLDPSLITVP